MGLCSLMRYYQSTAVVEERRKIVSPPLGEELQKYAKLDSIWVSELCKSSALASRCHLVLLIWLASGRKNQDGIMRCGLSVRFLQRRVSHGLCTCGSRLRTCQLRSILFTSHNIVHLHDRFAFIIVASGMHAISAQLKRARDKRMTHTTPKHAIPTNAPIPICSPIPL
jgi:hypothetical protein